MNSLKTPRVSFRQADGEQKDAQYKTSDIGELKDAQYNTSDNSITSTSTKLKNTPLKQNLPE